MYTYKAKLDRIIDGDTVDAHIDLGFDITIHKRIRLAGIDTPESRTRDLEEKERGLASKARLEELLGEGDCVIESNKIGKYGRVLGTIFVEGINDDNLTADPQPIKVNINQTPLELNHEAKDYLKIKTLFDLKTVPMLLFH